MPYFSASSPFVRGTSKAGESVIFAVQNGRESMVNVTLRRGVFQRDPNAVVLTTVMPQIRTYRADSVQSPLGLRTAVTVPWNTAQPSDSNVQVLIGSDFSYYTRSLVPISAGDIGQRAYATRMQSLIGQVLTFDLDLFQAQPIVLAPGSAFVAEISAETALSDPAAAGSMFQLAWEETPITTFTISGTVTDGGTGVVGAKVTVLVSDDFTLANAYKLAVVTTTTGGAWSVEIPAGKVAYAYAQHESSGTFYTAPGRPYIT
jgi:hypothetical protein